MSASERTNYLGKTKDEVSSFVSTTSRGRSIRYPHLAVRQGSFRGGRMGIESTYDLQVRQGLLKFIHSSVGDLGLGEVKLGKFDQPLEMHQPGLSVT